MPEAEIQYVSDESGEPTAVIVPISLWREIESERETAYLLRSEMMKRRLHEARERQQGLSFDEAIEKLGIWCRRVRGSRVVGGAGSSTGSLPAMQRQTRRAVQLA
jgi:hypothetical protein